MALFLSGLIIYFYPAAENYFYDRAVADEQQQFFEQTGNSPDAENRMDELYRLLRRYNLDLYEQKQMNLTDPFSYSQPSFDLSEYGIPDNCIGFVTIEKMDITLPIRLGANHDNMEIGAVHLTETSFPVGGENTNAVIAAHRGSKKNMFRHIDKLEPGDLVFIRNFRETLAYRVAETKIINPTDVHDLLIQDGRDMVTLVSCHPYGKSSQRYVVYCERADN